jgi:hypothetical protein
MDIREEFLGLIDVLEEGCVAYAVCGGIALLFHGYPRLTRDIDLLVLEKDLERIKELAAAIGFRVAPPHPIVFGMGSSTEILIHRISKFAAEDHLVLDLIVVSPSLRGVWETREKHPLEGREVWVVSAAGLVEMKRRTGRKRDEADIEALEGGDAES